MRLITRLNKVVAAVAVVDPTGKNYQASSLKPASTATLFGNGVQIASTTVDAAGVATWVLSTAPASGTAMTYDGVISRSAGIAVVGAPGNAPLNFRFGTYTTYGSGGVSEYQKFETMLGRQGTITHDFGDRTSYAALRSSTADLLKYWVAFPRGAFMFSLPLTCNDDPSHANVTNGNHDADFTAVLNSIKNAAFPTSTKIYIRIGWEFNLPQPWAWSLGKGSPANTISSYAPAFSRVATLVRQILPNAIICFCPNKGSHDYPDWTAAEPADKSLFDVYALDAYNDFYGSTNATTSAPGTAQRYQDCYMNIDGQGLAKIISRAATLGKKWGISEAASGWSANDKSDGNFLGGDDGEFVRQVSLTAKGSSQCEFVIWFDALDGGYNARSYESSNVTGSYPSEPKSEKPLTAAALRLHFGSGAAMPYAVASAPTVPVNTAAPTIASAANVNTAVIATTGSWSGSPTAYSYQWFVDSSAVSGATKAFFIPRAGDAGKPLYCAVAATNGGGKSSATSSNVTTLAAAVVPNLTGSNILPAGNRADLTASGWAWNYTNGALTTLAATSLTKNSGSSIDYNNTVRTLNTSPTANTGYVYRFVYSGTTPAFWQVNDAGNAVAYGRVGVNGAVVVEHARSAVTATSTQTANAGEYQIAIHYTATSTAGAIQIGVLAGGNGVVNATAFELGIGEVVAAAPVAPSATPTEYITVSNNLASSSWAKTGAPSSITATSFTGTHDDKLSYALSFPNVTRKKLTAIVKSTSHMYFRYDNTNKGYWETELYADYGGKGSPSGYTDGTNGIGPAPDITLASIGGGEFRLSFEFTPSEVGKVYNFAVMGPYGNAATMTYRDFHIVDV